MALFGSTKKDTTSLSTKVRPTVVRTQNVAKELQAMAKSYKIKVDTLDFNVFEIQTYTRMSEGEKGTSGEWEEISHDDLYELDEELALLNPNFQIKQMYEVEIFLKSDAQNRYKDFKLAVGANATKCKVYLSILAGSKIKYTNGLEEQLQDMIKKRKIRAGILVNIFDEMLENVISKVTSHIRVEEKAEYNKNETLLIAQGYEPTITINDALILHYDKKEEADEKTKIDYASRGFIQSVQEGELLIEYIKAKEGKPGRNCRGEYMSPAQAVIANEPTFNINDTIKIVETDDSTQYIANENGYIALEENTYLIKTDVDVGEISFKTTGSISTGLDSDVTISVRETDAVKDAIGTGMNVEVTEIDIDGNVGSNATVKALKATIGGQTHKTASITADKLDINVHKGIAHGKNVHITRLEHGEVNGDTVDIVQALGGVINAKEIDIDICASYVKATASRRIEIHKMQGSENIFTIDPLVRKDLESGLNDNKHEIKELTSDIKTIDKDVKKYKRLVKEGTASFLDIKKRLLHYKKNGVKMPASFVQKYKQFGQMQVHLKELETSLSIKQEKLELLSSKTVSFQDDILDARIINRDRWSGFNEIKFKLIKPEIELVYKPQEGSLDKIFGVVEVEQGEFEIQAMKE
ncbi:MAG: FapA family protein [Sulfurimonas sp.]